MRQLRKVLRWFLPLWRTQIRGMTLVVMLTALAVAANTIYPLMFKFVIDNIADGHALAARKWVLILLGAGVLQQIIQWILPVSRAWMNLHFSLNIRMGIFSRLLRKTTRFFVKYRSGDLVTRLTDDIDVDDKLSWYSCSGIMRPVEAFLSLGFALAVMFALDWRLTLFAFAPLPVVVWLLTMTEKLQERHYSERQRRTSETVDVLESAFSGVRIVLSYVAERAQEILFDKALVQRERAEKNVLTLRAVLEGLGALMNQSGVIVVLFVGAVYVVRHEITIGDFYAFVTYLSRLTGPLWTISWFFVSTTLVGASVDRFKELEQEEEREPGQAKPSCVDELVLEQVSFAWPSELADDEGQLLLKKVDLRVRAGETVALVGPVGCGKSTMLELAAGLLEPKQGRIHLGGTEVSDIAPEVMGEVLGWVPQENLLFSGSVAENVSLGRTGISRVEIDGALLTACVADEFPREREIAQGGVGLSGGQRSRVAMARALVTKPAFLLLDDATSALDAETEVLFWKRTRQWLPKAGILVSTHREATAREADRVVWLQEGRLIHEGRHEELLRDHAEYQQLFAKEDQPALQSEDKELLPRVG